MNAPHLILLAILLPGLTPTGWSQIPVLRRSDVVTMYQADRPVYEEYGVTVLAWGGRPTPKSLEAAQGVKFFGSVGMVTEFSRYHDRFPQTYEQGLCRDLEGQPFKVPWLTDHQHQGIPYWWCCTRQPVFRQYLSERVTDTVKAGAQGVHIDDHLGTAGALWMGGCFCDRCVEAFRAELGRVAAEDLAKLGIQDRSAFNFREVARSWLKEQPTRKIQDHPLWPRWRVFQLRGAAGFMEELRALAARTAERPIPMSANACLLWGPHLADFRALDYFSAEIEHHASARRFSDDPLVAYRLADAVNRPLASTASGGDWAFIKEQNLPGLVQGWIAFSYAAGHGLMAPHRQWCYTPQKGTHWYAGPKEKFAPLYQFVRQHASLFDGYENHADVTIAISHRTIDRDTGKVLAICNRLAATNLSYRLALGSDEIVNHPLSLEELQGAAPILVIERKDFTPADLKQLAKVESNRLLNNVDEVLAKTKPAVQVESPGTFRVLPRIKAGSAAIHLVNWAYDPARDGVSPALNVRLRLDLRALGVPAATEVRQFAPGAQPLTLPLQKAMVVVPQIGLWTVLELKGR
jgi:hypothetical protein